MTESNSKALSSYFKAVKKNCPKVIRKRLMTELESGVSDFLKNNENAEIEDIINRFGKPEQFANEYIAGLDDDEKQKLVNDKQRNVKTCIIAVVSVCILLFIISLIVLHLSRTQPAKQWNRGSTDASVKGFVYGTEIR